MSQLQIYTRQAGTITAVGPEIGEIEDGIRQCMVNILEDSIRIGQLLSRAKKLLVHGEYMSWLEGVMSQPRASECLWLAEAYGDRGSDVYHFLHDSGIKSKTKALAVRNVRQEVLADVLVSGRLGDTPIAELGSLPSRQLKLALKEAAQPKRAQTAPVPIDSTPLEDAFSRASSALGEAVQLLQENEWDPELCETIESYILRLDRQLSTADKIFQDI